MPRTSRVRASWEKASATPPTSLPTPRPSSLARCGADGKRVSYLVRLRSWSALPSSETSACPTFHAQKGPATSGSDVVTKREVGASRMEPRHQESRSGRVWRSVAHPEDPCARDPRPSTSRSRPSPSRARPAARPPTATRRPHPPSPSTANAQPSANDVFLLAQRPRKKNKREEKGLVLTRLHRMSPFPTISTLPCTLRASDRSFDCPARPPSMWMVGLPGHSGGAAE